MIYLSIYLWGEFLYGQEARFNLEDGHIMSATGVQEGDQLGLLLFYLVLHPFIHRVRENCKLTHAQYLDDETIIADSHEMLKPLTSFRRQVQD